MLWLILSIFTAFFESMKDVFSKKSLINLDEYVVSWSLSFFALIFLIPLLFFIDFPSLGDKFWMALFVGGTLNVTAIILYMKAIKYSDLSLSIPMVAFTPLFLVMTSPLIVGEFPTVFGLIGIFLIVSGSYLLNTKEIKEDYFAPFKALLMEKGTRLMLAVAFVWSITSNFDKIGVKNSSPIFWAISINIFLAVVLLPIMLYKSQANSKQLFSGMKGLVPIGLFSALTLAFQMMAINLALVAYVISIKRTSAIMSVLFGYFIFKEKDVAGRLLGVVIMVFGVLFIAIS